MHREDDVDILHFTPLAKLVDEKKRAWDWKSWSAFYKGACLAIGLVVIKYFVNLFNFELFPDTTIIACYISGVFFIMAIILAGVLSDYKDSEKMSDELPAILKSMFLFTGYSGVNGEDLIREMRTEIVKLVWTINNSFVQQGWESKEIHNHVLRIENNLQKFRKDGADMHFLTCFQTEMTGVYRMLNRIGSIMGTTFASATYIFSYIAIIIALFLLIFVNMPSPHEELMIVGAVGFILVTLMILIRDMDDPFEIGRHTLIDVDLSHFADLEKDLHELMDELHPSWSAKVS
jgi:hypothetical protein